MSQEKRDTLLLSVDDIDRRLVLLAMLRPSVETDAERASIDAEIDRLNALRQAK